MTSPSAGVEGAAAGRIDFAWVAARGRVRDVVVGRLMDGAGITAGPAADRAAELTAMLCDPTIRCVIPPWGGETAIDLVDLLDWDALAAAEPTWLVGFSDLSTLLVPLTTRLGWATVHGDNLADTPYRAPDGLLSRSTSSPAPARTSSTTPGDRRLVAVRRGPRRATRSTRSARGGGSCTGPTSCTSPAG